MAGEPLSNSAVHQWVPESYVLPKHKRPRSSPPSPAAAIPVVDLGGDDSDTMAEQIVAAGRELGFFQVINHGVPEEVMGAMMSAAEAFFRLPTEEKMALYSTDSTKLPRFLSFHTSLGKEQVPLLAGLPQDRSAATRSTSSGPAGRRSHRGSLAAALEPYAAAARAVALRVLRLAADGEVVS